MSELTPHIAVRDARHAIAVTLHLTVKDVAPSRKPVRTRGLTARIAG